MPPAPTSALALQNPQPSLKILADSLPALLPALKGEGLGENPQGFLKRGGDYEGLGRERENPRHLITEGGSEGQTHRTAAGFVRGCECKIKLRCKYS